MPLRLLLLTLLPQSLLLLLTLLLLLLLTLLLLLPNKLHGSAKKAGLGPAFFLCHLPLKNLAPTKPIHLIGHPDPFRLTI